MVRRKDSPHRRRPRHSARAASGCHSARGNCTNSRGSSSAGGAVTTTILTARRLITADTIVEYPRIAIDSDGAIVSIESGKPNTETTTLAPAFLDIHIHGAAGHDVMEGTHEAVTQIGEFLASC